MPDHKLMCAGWRGEECDCGVKPGFLFKVNIEGHLVHEGERAREARTGELSPASLDALKLQLYLELHRLCTSSKRRLTDMEVNVFFYLTMDPAIQRHVREALGLKAREDET
jgi:hypothetical protein